jgi:hypothetical protein
MSDEKIVVLNGDLAVVWHDSHDSTPKDPKELYRLYWSAVLRTFELELIVEGGSFWILSGERGEQSVQLVRYESDGSERVIQLPDDLKQIFSPSQGVPTKVWKLAVYEAHERICPGVRGGCDCTDLRRQLHGIEDLS